MDKFKELIEQWRDTRDVLNSRARTQLSKGNYDRCNYNKGASDAIEYCMGTLTPAIYLMEMLEGNGVVKRSDK